MEVIAIIILCILAVIFFVCFYYVIFFADIIAHYILTIFQIDDKAININLIYLCLFSIIRVVSHFVLLWTNKEAYFNDKYSNIKTYINWVFSIIKYISILMIFIEVMVLIGSITKWY